MNPLHPLISALASELQVGPLETDEGGYLQLCFEEDLVVMIKVENEPPSLTLFCRIGEAPDNDPDFAEELLSSNLFWRDTAGATLSMERYSRSVLLARRFSLPDPPDPTEFIAQAKLFIDTCREWIRILPTLTSASASTR